MSPLVPLMLSLLLLVVSMQQSAASRFWSRVILAACLWGYAARWQLAASACLFVVIVGAVETLRVIQ